MLISARKPLRFTPEHRTGEEKPPVYLIAVPTLLTRADFRREVAAAGLLWHDDSDMFEGLRAAVRACMDPDTAAETIAAIDKHVAARREREEAAREAAPGAGAENGTAAPQDDEAFLALGVQVAELEARMQRVHPPYKRMLAERAHFLAAAPILAAQMFLQGWENAGVTFERIDGYASDDCLMRLPEEDVRAIGWKVMSLFRPTEQQTKN